MDTSTKPYQEKQYTTVAFRAFERNEKKILPVLVFIALAIRLLLLFFLKSYEISDDAAAVINGADEGWVFGFETGRIAKSLATGKGFSSPLPRETGTTAWLMPGYPLLLALIFKFFGVYTTSAAIVTLTINCLASALTSIPVYHIAKTVFNRNVGYIAAAALAFYPPSIWHALNTIWDTTVFAFLVMVLFAALVRLPERLNLKNAALFGFFMGVVALVNAVIIAFYPFVLVWLFLRPLAKAQKVKSIVTMCLVGSITFLPWIVRNYVVFDRLMLRSNFGLEFKLGNSPKIWDAFESKGGKHTSFWELGHPSIDEDEFLRFERLGEVNYLDQCFDDTMVFIRENPSKFLRLTLKRIQDFWLSEFDLGTVNPAKIFLSVSGVKKLCYMLPILFMLIGIFFAARQKREIALLVAFILLLPVTYYTTHVIQRYRYPMEPIMLVLASYGFCGVIWKLKNKVWSRYA